MSRSSQGKEFHILGPSTVQETPEGRTFTGRVAIRVRSGWEARRYRQDVLSGRSLETE